MNKKQNITIGQNGPEKERLKFGLSGNIGPESLAELVQHHDDGFWKKVEKGVFSADTQRKMPRACDRFWEARHFIQLIRQLPPIDDSAYRANWYAGAHLNAVIGIRDAGEADFVSAGDRNFKFTPLYKEFYLQADDRDAFDRDPSAFNRAYGDLRNLRVHYAIKIVTLEDRVLAYDISSGEPPRKRWFFHQISKEEHKLLLSTQRRPLCSPYELKRFNATSEKSTMIAMAARHLCILSGMIEKTAARLL